MKRVKVIFLDVLLMERDVLLKLPNAHNIKELKHNVINFKEYQDYKNVQIVILQLIIRHVIKNNVSMQQLLKMIVIVKLIVKDVCGVVKNV
jgi:hypothetical protein